MIIKLQKPLILKNTLLGKTITIDLDSSGAKALGDKGILSLIISEDGKSLDWTLSVPKEVSGYDIYSGHFDNVSIVVAGTNIKITSGEKLSVDLQTTSSGYSIKSESKVDEITVKTTASVSLSAVTDTTTISSFYGHQFWYAGSYTAGLLKIEEGKISLVVTTQSH